MADAFVDSLGNEATFGQTYDLVGPKVYTLRELVDYTARLTGSNTRIIALSEGWAYLQAGLMWLAAEPDDVAGQPAFDAGRQRLRSRLQSAG